MLLELLLVQMAWLEIHKVQTLSQKRFCVYHYPHIPLASNQLKAKKCHLFCKKVVYLGHVISEAGIATHPEKTKIVESWPVPTNVKELRSFMG
jgi:hypothetical protein